MKYLFEKNIMQAKKENIGEEEKLAVQGNIRGKLAIIPKTRQAEKKNNILPRSRKKGEKTPEIQIVFILIFNKDLHIYHQASKTYLGTV